ncbi:MAG: phosphate ABC transporter permease PstA [Candidatus Heimdallarchaeota archaeon]
MSDKTQKIELKPTAEVGQSFDELPRRKRLLSPKQGQKTAYVMLGSSAVFIFLVIAVFLGYIIVNGLANFSFRLIFSPFNPTTDQYGIGPAILGTFVLVSGSVAIALPLGILAAIYLTEYTKGGVIVNIIDQGINNLAGVPSVVIGIFGYTFFCIFLKIGQSIIAGWLTLACMLLPTIIRTSQEALKSVPDEYREGSLALGITKWRTIRYVVLPSALPGILTGAILSLGRAAGETAAILFVGSGALFLKWFGGFTGTFSTLPYMILHLYRSSGGWEKVGSVMWLIAFVLMLVVFSFNAVAMVVRSKFEKKRTGN